MKILNSIFLIENEIFLDQDYLNIRYKTSKDKIKEIVNKYINDSTFIKKNPTTKRKFIISLSLLNEELSQYFKFPTKSSFIKKIKEAQRKKRIEEKLNRRSTIEFIFNHFFKQRSSFKYIYDDRFTEKEIVEQYSKTHAIFLAIMELRENNLRIVNRKVPMKDIYNFYKTIPGLVFNPKHYQSFANKIKQLKSKDDISSSLIHDLRGRTSNNHKLKDDVENEIKRLFLDPKKLNASHILEDVNNYLIKQNRQPISLSSVERVIASRYTQNELMLGRHGKNYTYHNLYPRCFFEDPETNGVLWALDGTRLQFMYLDNENNICFLSYVVVLDGFSKKIIGYSYGTYENTRMIVEAVKMACDNTQYFPTEIVHDNSTAFKSERMKELIAYSKIEGVNWRAIKVGNPGDNGYVERYFGVFQESVCKRCDGYIGDGITSSNLNGKPSKEELKKISLKKNIRTLDQLKKEVSNLIELYNNRNKRNGISPNILSVQKEPNLAIKLNPILYVKLFWLKTEHTIRKSCVIISYLTKTYSYNIYDTENILKLNGVKVIVRFNPKNFKKVLIFDIKNGNYITTLDQFIKIPKPLIERKKGDQVRTREHSYKLKEIQKHLESRIEEIYITSKRNNDNLPPEISTMTFVPKREARSSEDNLTRSRIESLTNAKTLKNKKDKKIKIGFENLYKQQATLKIVS